MRALPVLLLVAASALAPGLGFAAPHAPARPATAEPRSAAGKVKPPARPAAPAVAHRPLTLAAQNILGRAEGPRVLFVHTGPTIALEDAPKHPSYLRDDFTAALSSPVTVHVRNIEPLRVPTPAGGNR
jgi:hypothetical protein